MDVKTLPLPPVYDGLDKAASDLATAAMRPGIGGKEQVLYYLRGGLFDVANAVRMIALALSEAGYGPEITDPLYATVTNVSAGATSAETAMHAIASLAGMKLGDLAASGRQVPHNSEMNGA